VLQSNSEYSQGNDKSNKG